MRDGHRVAQPAQAVGLEVERAQHRRGDSEGVEGREAVVPVAGQRQLRGADRATRLGLGFEDEDVPALVGQQVGGHQPVRAGADDYGVGHRVGSLV